MSRYYWLIWIIVLALPCMAPTALAQEESCTHDNTEIVGAVEPGCAREGYTGDGVCLDCGALVRTGALLPALEHVYGEPQGVREATCVEPGYTGERICVRCGDVLPGEETPLAGHDLGQPLNARAATCLRAGYTGTRICSVCGAEVPGDEQPRLAHDFAGNVCAACGWREPGFYRGDELVLGWSELEAGGYVVAEDGVLLDVPGNFMGVDALLVVGEDITELSGYCLYNKAIERLWLPCTITRVEDFAMGTANTRLQECRVFFAFDDGLEGTFNLYGCEKLKSFAVPEGSTNVPDHMFTDCAALTDVHLPDTVTRIGTCAFQNCTALEQIDLPEGLTTICYRAFWGSGLTGLTLPAALTEVSEECVMFAGSLERLDMSACAQIMSLPSVYTCPALSEFLLPPALEELNCVLDGCKSLKSLALPDTVSSARINFGGYLETIVWPVALIDGSGLTECPIKTIYYRGSQAQWQLCTGSALFPEAEVLFDYEPDAVA